MKVHRIQGDLFQHFSGPLAFGPRHYVPILKSMSGERRALELMPDAVRNRVTPLIEARDSGDVEAEDEAEDRRTFLKGLPGQLAGSIKSLYPFYLDFPRTASNFKLASGSKGRDVPVNAIEWVYQECRDRDLWFIPVVGRRHDDLRLKQVAAAAKVDERGVAIRLPVAGTFYPDGLGAKALDLAGRLQVDPEILDLILEIGHLGGAGGITASVIAEYLEDVSKTADFRSVVLAGTVVPNTTAGWDLNGVTAITRLEWNLWCQLRGMSAKLPTYADYGVQHPAGPRKKGGGIPRANVRYTATESLFYSLGDGSGVTKENVGQYRGICERIVATGRFRGEDFSWGDRVIAQTARGAPPDVGQNHWRAVGTSHHLRQIVDDLESASPT
jgi:hypothetical protein